MEFKITFDDLLNVVFPGCKMTVKVAKYDRMSRRFYGYDTRYCGETACKIETKELYADENLLDLNVTYIKIEDDGTLLVKLNKFIAEED